MTDICVSTLTVIGSDNGLSPGRCQAIILTNDGILLIGPLGTNFRGRKPAFDIRADADFKPQVDGEVTHAASFNFMISKFEHERLSTGILLAWYATKHQRYILLMWKYFIMPFCAFYISHLMNLCVFVFVQNPDFLPGSDLHRHRITTGSYKLASYNIFCLFSV